MEQALEVSRRAEDVDEFEAVRRGWCLGEAGARKELLARMRERIGVDHYGSERSETDLEKAERIDEAELKSRDLMMVTWSPR